MVNEIGQSISAVNGPVRFRMWQEFGRLVRVKFYKLR